MPTQQQTQTFPPQSQARRPGLEEPMSPQPLCKGEWYQGSDKLKDKVALITGGDSGIGRAVAIFFAKEGADVAVVYLEEHEDARETKRLVEKEKRRCVLLPGDVGDEKFCARAVDETVRKLGKLDILDNNASEQHPQEGGIERITAAQLERTFRTNVFGYFFMSKAALAHLKEGSSIIN